MIQVIHMGKILFGKRREARDWAKRMAACVGGTAFEPLTGHTMRIVFSNTYESIAAYEKTLKNPSAEYQALLKENREKHLLEDSERYIHQAIE